MWTFAPEESLQAGWDQTNLEGKLFNHSNQRDGFCSILMDKIFPHFAGNKEEGHLCKEGWFKKKKRQCVLQELTPLNLQIYSSRILLQGGI